MTGASIAHRRLHNQRLTDTHLRRPEDVVAWLGAVQAQEYAHARWALGLRLPNTSDNLIEQALAEGRILRTHVMRPTWHFVAPADIRWLLALTGPRVDAVNGTMYRKLQLDDALFRRSNAVIAGALRGGVQLTRAELGVELARAGIHAEGMRLGYIVHRAELDAVVCSGVRRGKQFTYALLDERAPQATALCREEALAELVRRFFTSHGPATVQDFAWWSGLTQADVKMGLELAKPAVVQEVIDGKSYWSGAEVPGVPQPAAGALLLPPYDEYTIAYKDHSAILDPQFAQRSRDAVYGGVMVIDGQVVGYWRRTLGKAGAEVLFEPSRPLTDGERAAFVPAIERYSQFLELPVTYTWS